MSYTSSAGGVGKNTHHGEGVAEPLRTGGEGSVLGLGELANQLAANPREGEELRGHRERRERVNWSGSCGWRLKEDDSRTGRFAGGFCGQSTCVHYSRFTNPPSHSPSTSTFATPLRSVLYFVNSFGLSCCHLSVVSRFRILAPQVRDVGHIIVVLCILLQWCFISI